MYGECVLCGKQALLETHHIIPRAYGIPGFPIDDERNLINVCKDCHRKLTPSGLIAQYGAKRSRLHMPCSAWKIFDRFRNVMDKMPDELVTKRNVHLAFLYALWPKEFKKPTRKDFEKSSDDQLLSTRSEFCKLFWERGDCFDFTVYDADTRMPVSNQEKFALSHDYKLYLQASDGSIIDEIPYTFGRKYIIRCSWWNGDEKEIRY